MYCPRYVFIFLFFFFNDTATTEIYTLSLHDALPISRRADIIFFGLSDTQMPVIYAEQIAPSLRPGQTLLFAHGDRKSTRLNSSHLGISYAVFCLKKKTALILQV